MSLLINLGIYLFSFVLTWVGAGMIVSSVDHLAKKLKMSSFAVSFFLLGMMTSTPEFFVGVTALIKNDPEVYIGNLLGGITTIFLLIIPLLAILGKKVAIRHDLTKSNLLFALGVILAPAAAIIDQKITTFEAFLLMVFYTLLFFFVQKQQGFLEDNNQKILSASSYSHKDVFRIIGGIILLILASHFIVDKTIYFAHQLHISTFVISLIVLSLGTNLPELSLAIRAVFSGKKDIAFGDYIGSAAANTLLFGLFSFLHNGQIVSNTNFTYTFLAILLALGLFYYFAHIKMQITRNQGFITLTIFILFIAGEFLVK